MAVERMVTEEMTADRDRKVHDAEGDGQVLIIKAMKAEVRFRRN